MIRSRSSAALLALLLTGCPAFFVERGALVQPTRNLTPPSISSLPAPDALVDMRERWTRDARIGVAGAVEGILRDPRMVSAEIARAGAVQSLNQSSMRELLAREWSNAFGSQLDRWTIDLTWRFDEQFVKHQNILDPAGWTFKLVVDEQFEYVPISVMSLSQSQVPEQHFWEGKTRLWFPWRDAQNDRLVLAGNTRAIRLRMQHPTGSADLYWRFRTAY